MYITILSIQKSFFYQFFNLILRYNWRKRKEIDFHKCSKSKH